MPRAAHLVPIMMFVALIGMTHRVLSSETVGARKLVAGEKRYKPSILFCPASVLDQTYQEAISFFGSDCLPFT